MDRNDHTTLYHPLPPLYHPSTIPLPSLYHPSTIPLPSLYHPSTIPLPPDPPSTIPLPSLYHPSTIPLPPSTALYHPSTIPLPSLLHPYIMLKHAKTIVVSELFFEYIYIYGYEIFQYKCSYKVYTYNEPRAAYMRLKSNKPFPGTQPPKK